MATHRPREGAAPGFEPAQALTELVRAVAESDDTAYVVSRELKLMRTNRAWSVFAQANGGADTLLRWPRGASIVTAIPPVLHDYYVGGFERVWRTGAVWEHDYECSSPDRFRRFRMLVYPANAMFLVIVNSLIEELAHDRTPYPADDASYRVEGIITMCSHCRRARYRLGRERWDWVPAFVAQMPHDVSHGLCEPCAIHYFR